MKRIRCRRISNFWNFFHFVKIEIIILLMIFSILFSLNLVVCLTSRKIGNVLNFVHFS